MFAKSKTVFRGFRYQDCDDFAAYLNHMARRGWHFREWKAGLVFEQGPPEESRYAVEIFTDGSEYDTRPEPKTQEFAAYCEAAGWQLVDAKKKFVIFKAIRENPLPIMTDRERLDSVARSIRKEIFYHVILAAVWVAMRIGDYATAFERYIFSDFHLLITVFWALLLLSALVRCGGFFLWKFRCKKLLEEGKLLFFGKGRNGLKQNWFQIFSGIMLVVILTAAVFQGDTAMAVFSGVYLGALLLMGLLIAVFRPDAVTNQIIQVVFNVLLVLVMMVVLVAALLGNEPAILHTPSLTYEDFGVEIPTEDIRSSELEEGILGTWEYANLDCGNDFLYYHLYTTEHSWILQEIWERETDGKVNETRTDCTTLWGAREAFRNNAGNYLIRYDDRIWVICPSLETPLTQEQISRIIETLEGN